MALIYLDIETTGLDPHVHEVWEMAYAVGDGPILSSVVDHDITKVATASPAALRIGDYFGRGSLLGKRRSQLAMFETELKDQLDGATVVGSNPSFDTAFLRARWRYAPWRHRLFDIAVYAMPAFDLIEPQGLAYVAEQLGVQPPDHTAAGDVYTLRECHRALRSLYRRDQAA